MITLFDSTHVSDSAYLLNNCLASFFAKTKMAPHIAKNTNKTVIITIYVILEGIHYACRSAKNGSTS